jgi:A/G-specific adenine glycosylase
MWPPAAGRNLHGAWPPYTRSVSVSCIPGLPHVQRALLAWHRAHAMRAPWRQSGDPYEVLVAAVMAQQTQMSRVMPSYQRFIAAFPTLESLAAATAGDVIRVWAGMGYNQRAVRLHRAARTIAEGGWPHDAASLARIDGIGPFTAAIIASFAFGEPAACVDTNVRRVLGRLAGKESIDAKRLQALADSALLVREPARWNQALMDYGARVCTVRPKCGECVVARWCPSRERLAAPMPRTARRTPVGAQPAAPALVVPNPRPLPRERGGTIAMVADERAVYDAKPRPKKPQPKYEGSSRYHRGRIIDALRALPAGASISPARLRRAIADGGNATPSADELLVLVGALEAQGLISTRRGRVALPE